MEDPFRIIPKCGRDDCARILGIGEEDDNYPKLWQYGLWSFQASCTKLEEFSPKNQHFQRKLLKFEFWINDELSKIGHHFNNIVN